MDKGLEEVSPTGALVAGGAGAAAAGASAGVAAAGAVAGVLITSPPA